VAQVSLLRPGCSGRFDEAAGRTADPSTSLRFGRDDKGRVVTSRKVSELDGELGPAALRRPRSLDFVRFDRDDKVRQLASERQPLDEPEST
jgi:hypothetical protein